MKLLAQALCLCLVLALPYSHGDEMLDRCEGLEMDAVTVNEHGVPLFFSGEYVFVGFQGKGEKCNRSVAAQDDHHPNHIDAAFHMKCKDDAHHDHVYYFLDDKVFIYHQEKLHEGFPKNISEVFPGIPDHLDAAVECPKPECEEDSVIFFKGHKIYHYNVKTKAVEEKECDSMPNCTAALRFLDHHYCFHGHMFSRFDPKTGEVHAKYPKEARETFVKCSKFGENSNHVERERCSHVHLDAITSDHGGNMYAFRGHHYIRRDEGNDTLTANRLEDDFKEVECNVDAVFSYNDHLHMIKGEMLYVYQDDEPHAHKEGYPKSVKEELGVEGPIDAAFVCEDHHIAHIVKGNHIYDVELNASPRVVDKEHTISVFDSVNAVKCDAAGVKVFVGNHFYHFGNLTEFVAARALPEQRRISVDVFGCDH